MLGDLEAFPPTGPDHANWGRATVGRQPTALPPSSGCHSNIAIALRRQGREASGRAGRQVGSMGVGGGRACTRAPEAPRRRRPTVAPRAPQSVPNVTLPVTRRGMAGPFGTV